MKQRRGPRKAAIKFLKRRGRPALNRFLARYSRVGDPAVFDPGTFAFTRILEANWRTIQAEALTVLSFRDEIPAFHEVSPDQYRISNSGWKTFWFEGFGSRSRVAEAVCPETSRLLGSVPGVETALFSILDPGQHVPAHRGVFKGIINYHLGLVVPAAKDRCRMRVGGETFHWEEGKSAIFDDTNEHEVWNDTNEHRVVLMLQFRRPLRPPGEQVSRLFLRILRLTPYVRQAVRNQASWDKRLATLLAAQRRAQATPPPLAVEDETAQSAYGGGCGVEKR